MSVWVRERLTTWGTLHILRDDYDESGKALCGARVRDAVSCLPGELVETRSHQTRSTPRRARTCGSCVRLAKVAP